MKKELLESMMTAGIEEKRPQRKMENFIKEFQPLQLLWMVGGASAPTNIPIMRILELA